MQVSLSAEREIERRLDAYARVRLAPDPRATARMRARVMREARLAFAARADTPATMVAIDSLKARHRSHLLRRGAGLLVAAGLTLGVAGGAMAASQAGGPLYPARVWLEAVTLPTGASDRADAEIVRLESRLAEVTAAARKGDRGAVAAALIAYQDIADEAISGAGADEIALERIRAALDRHVAVLQAVSAKVPPQAQAAIERNIQRAIEHNAATVWRLENHGAGPSTPNGPPAANPGNGGSSGGSGGQPAATTNPVTTSEPTTTPKPTRPPKPTQAPASEATPRPDAPPSAGPPGGQPTPRPHKTPPVKPRPSKP